MARDYLCLLPSSGSEVEVNKHQVRFYRTTSFSEPFMANACFCHQYTFLCGQRLQQARGNLLPGCQWTQPGKGRPSLPFEHFGVCTRKVTRTTTQSLRGSIVTSWEGVALATSSPIFQCMHSWEGVATNAVLPTCFYSIARCQSSVLLS